jgi:hypothetical protein
MPRCGLMYARGRADKTAIYANRRSDSVQQRTPPPTHTHSSAHHHRSPHPHARPRWHVAPQAGVPQARACPRYAQAEEKRGQIPRRHLASPVPVQGSACCTRSTARHCKPMLANAGLGLLLMLATGSSVTGQHTHAAMRGERHRELQHYFTAAHSCACHCTLLRYHCPVHSRLRCAGAGQLSIARTGATHAYSFVSTRTCVAVAASSAGPRSRGPQAVRARTRCFQRAARAALRGRPSTQR